MDCPLTHKEMCHSGLLTAAVHTESVTLSICHVMVTLHTDKGNGISLSCSLCLGTDGPAS